MLRATVLSAVFLTLAGGCGSKKLPPEDDAGVTLNAPFKLKYEEMNFPSSEEPQEPDAYNVILSAKDPQGQSHDCTFIVGLTRDKNLTARQSALAAAFVNSEILSMKFLRTQCRPS